MAKNAVLNLRAFEAPDYLKDTEDAVVEEIPAERFLPFPGHPFSLREESEEMEALAESVGENGILVPVLARPAGGGMYELISGHRRLHAAKLAGLKKIPAVIRGMDDDQAVIAMVHSNQYRENIPVSEKSHAYRMCFEAEKHQGKKDGNETAETVANGSASRRTVYRMIRLSYLNETLLQMVDAKRIVMGAGVELSYLAGEAQHILSEVLSEHSFKVSPEQAKQLRRLDEEGVFSREAALGVLVDLKPREQTKVMFKKADIQAYFPEDTTAEEMEQVIINLLENYRMGGFNQADLQE